MRMMYRWVTRLILAVIGLGFAALWIPGVHLDHPSTLIPAVILLSLANATLRPLLVALTLPVTLLSLGLFLLVINAAMLGLVSWWLPGLHFDSFTSAMLTWFLIAFFQSVGNRVLGQGSSIRINIIHRP